MNIFGAESLHVAVDRLVVLPLLEDLFKAKNNRKM